MGAAPDSASVASALFGKVRRAVLALLFCHPDQTYHLREIARMTGTGQGSLQRELGRLQRAGLVIRRRQGNLVLYHANRQAPVFEELRGLMLKTVGLADVLRQALGPLADRIAVAFVYGSLARGEDRAGSDVDLLIIGGVGFAEVSAALGEAEGDLGREVNSTVYPVPEARERLAAQDHFLSSVLSGPKVFIVGGEDELSSLAGPGLAPGSPHDPAGDR